jgi:hypothetical protein
MSANDPKRTNLFIQASIARIRKRKLAFVGAVLVMTPICLILFWWHSSAKEHDPGHSRLRSREDKMKKLAVILLAAASLVGTAGAASAQWYGGGYYGGGYYGGRPYYGDQYRYRYYGDDYRYYGGGYYPPGRYRTWNGCQRGWTVQDGLCKPYRGY